MIFRVLLRLYIDALLRGNPFVVGLTMIGVAAVSVGPFYQGVTQRDPVAIGLMCLVAVLATILIAVALLDRKLNAKPKARPVAKGRPQNAMRPGPR
jgi:hypothetical protein